MAKLTYVSSVASYRIYAIGALIVVWMIWSLHFLDKDATHGVLSRLPSVGSLSSTAGSNGSDLRPLVLYTYADSPNARDNFDFFIKSGLHGKADFIFIFNGESSASDAVPEAPNIRKIQRENTCFDLGAVGEVLKKGGLWKKYKRFVMMNASVRGPFFPVHSPRCWTDTFLNRITDKVKLVGTTVNCKPRTHLQSMLLATDEVGMAILLDPSLALSASEDDYFGSSEDPVGFSTCLDTMAKAIHAEVGTTSLIQSQGYAVDVVMTAPHSALSVDDFCEENGQPEDFLWEDRYFGFSLHPYETVFMKANRGIKPVLLDKMTEWHTRANLTSWDTCGR